jgi:hypothetical protein
MLAQQALYDVLQIGRLAGMIEASGTRRLPIARAEDQRVGRPAGPLREAQDAAEVVRSDRSLETVQHE